MLLIEYHSITFIVHYHYIYIYMNQFYQELSNINYYGEGGCMNI